MSFTMHGRDEPRAGQYPALDTTSGRFGRLFPELHGLHVPLHVLVALAGEMRDTPPPEQAPSSGWGTPTPPPTTDDRDNPLIPAGYTYLGQFIDHDITFDPVSSLEHAVRPEKLSNFRIPRLDLDSVYGGGPAASPHLYDKTQPGKLLIETREGVEDLPRNTQGTALVGDPRNDENQIISQLQLAVLKFHNARIDAARTFEEAQTDTRWHYQWVIVHDFLPRLVGRRLVHEILSQGPAFFTWPYQTFMPFEFSVAAYRFGHSQVRNGYQLRVDGPGFPVFGPQGQDLRGGQLLVADRQIQWRLFADFGADTGVPTPSREIDTKIADSLFALFGDGSEATPDLMRSLPLRNLRRGVALGVPSGQAVARAMHQRLSEQQSRQQLMLLEQDKVDLSRHDWDGEMPLWFYVLLEAELLGEQGARLGPVGGRIVAEVVLGLLEGDPTSFLSANPAWQPDETPDTFTLASFLRMAGATP